MVAHLITFDSAATVTMKGDVADVHSLRLTSVTMNMANNSRMIVKLEGTASFVVLTDMGQVRCLGMGCTLIGPDMHNLLSPLVMFKDSDSRLHYVHLELDNSVLVLHNSAHMPLRWDGRLFHLNYWSTTADAVINVLLSKGCAARLLHWWLCHWSSMSRSVVQLLGSIMMAAPSSWVQHLCIAASRAYSRHSHAPTCCSRIPTLRAWSAMSSVQADTFFLSLAFLICSGLGACTQPVSSKTR